MTDPRVLILAAGRGSRFLAAGGEGHKALAPVRGTTPLLWTLRVLAAAGAPEVCLVVGCHEEQIRAAVAGSGYPGPVSFVVNELWESTDSAYSFAVGAERLAGPLLLSYADVLLAPSLVTRLRDGADRNLLAVDACRPPAAWDMRAQVAGGRVTALSKTMPVATSHGESACFFRFTAQATEWLAQLGRQSLSPDVKVQFERMLSGVLDQIELEPVWCAEDEWCEVDVPAELDWARRLIDRAGAAVPGLAR